MLGSHLALPPPPPLPITAPAAHQPGQYAVTEHHQTSCFHLCPLPRTPPLLPGAHSLPPSPISFPTVHPVPILGLGAGYHRCCARPGPALADSVLRQRILQRHLQSERVSWRHGLPAVAVVPPPPHLGHCPSSKPLSLQWPAGSWKRPIALQCRFQELRLLAALAQDPFLEHRPRPTQATGVSLGSWRRE